MKTKIILLSFLMLLAAGYRCDAQKVSVSTDLVDWAYLWTMNGEVNVSVAQHVTVLAGGKINPWMLHLFLIRSPANKVHHYIWELIGNAVKSIY